MHNHFDSLSLAASSAKADQLEQSEVETPEGGGAQDGEEEEELDEKDGEGGDEPTGAKAFSGPSAIFLRLHQGEEDEEVLFRADCKLWKLVVWQFVHFLPL